MRKLFPVKRLKSAAKVVTEIIAGQTKDYGIMAGLLRRPATFQDLFRFLLLLTGASFLLSFYPFFF